MIYARGAQVRHRIRGWTGTIEALLGDGTDQRGRRAVVNARHIRHVVWEIELEPAPIPCTSAAVIVHPASRPGLRLVASNGERLP